VNRDISEPISPIQFTLLLHSVPHLGEKTLTRLLRYNARLRIMPGECLLLSADHWQTQYDLDPRAATFLVEHRAELLDKSAELARAARAAQISVLTCESMTYPTRLERYDDAPPPILYALGNLPLTGNGLTNEPLQRNSADSEQKQVGKHSDTGIGAALFTFTIAVSNGASPAALTRQDEIAKQLIECGGIPVTGHDRAPYKRLALSAQRLNRPTIYVFDCGLREAMGPEFDRPPFAAARIRDLIFDTKRDLALSPFRFDDHSLGANNRRRDRMIFALAQIIIAVDVGAGGGMEAECRRAHEQGVPVYAVPQGGRAGNETLLALGCDPLPESVEQITAQMRIAPRPAKTDRSRTDETAEVAERPINTDFRY